MRPGGDDSPRPGSYFCKKERAMPEPKPSSNLNAPAVYRGEGTRELRGARIARAAMRPDRHRGTAPQRRFETPESLPQATVDDATLNRALGRARHLTDINNHTLARRTFSRLFGYDDLTDEYGAILREQNRAGHLTQELAERRERAEEEMFRRIRMQYGDDVVRRIYRAL